VRLISLELLNYRKFKAVNIAFPDGLIGVIGANGSGKSTLMEALAWVIYGNLASRTSKEQIPTQGSGDEITQGILTLEIGNQIYQVIRQLKGQNLSSQAAVYVKQDGSLKEQAAKGTEATQIFMKKVLGLDYQSFFTSFFARQQELNLLSDLKTPAQRQNLIIRMLGIDTIDYARELIKKDRSLSLTKLETLKGTLIDENELQIELASKEKERNKANKALEKALANQKTKRDALEKIVLDYRSLEKNRDKHTSLKQDWLLATHRLKECQNNLKKYQQELKEINQTKTKLNKNSSQEQERNKLESKKTIPKIKDKQKYIQELEKLEVDLNLALKAKYQLSASIKNLKDLLAQTNENLERIKRLGPNEPCPLCKRKLEQHHQTLNNHYTAEITRITTELSSLSKTLQDKEKKAGELSKSIALRREEKEKLLQEKVHYQASIAALGDRENKATKEIRRLKTDIYQIKSNIENIRLQGKKLKFDEEKYLIAKKKYDTSLEAKHQLDLATKEYENNVRLSDLKIKEAKEKIDLYKSAKKNVDDLSKKHRQLDQLNGVFEKFRTNLVGRIRPALSEKSSHLLSQLSEGKYSQLEIDDKYEINAYDRDKKYPINRFSGGEKDLANLCLRLSISELMLERSQTDSSFLILDEVFGSQDSQRRSSILHTLGGLSKRYRQLFVITHIEDIKDAFESIISVQEDDDSKLSKISLSEGSNYSVASFKQSLTPLSSSSPVKGLVT